ncbi:MAG: PTS fructose transporter subunit IIA [Gammaproteobacteria bacterium]|nr:PTS fructose transporter subunit IIA [Gammaproteobacteria bacterium]MDH5594644.1 PTS fructose transporter subunit IIA [Gammaproteobacteria bacterium]MDH5614785.1 PTS fructose transporter subunit IIA [Gammaproteobacteria bacterium]
MSVGLLIITHDDIGKMLLATAVRMMNVCPLEAEVLSVPFSQDVENLSKQAKKLCTKLESGDGVLVLTDVYGSTPSNIASSLSDGETVRVIAGINLPMLIRVLNYPRLNLSELMIKALSGGRDGVLVCSPEDKLHLDEKKASQNN